MPPLTFTSPSTSRITSCKVHPVVLFTILDHYSRRSADQDRVIGALLGRVLDPLVDESPSSLKLGHSGGLSKPSSGAASQPAAAAGSLCVEITNAFAVPHSEQDAVVAVGKEYQKNMVQLHAKASYKGERVVGWYATTKGSDGQMIVETSSLIQDFYAKEVKPPVGSPPGADEPLHLVVDASLTTDAISVKAFVSRPVLIQGVALANIFEEVRVSVVAGDCERVAIDAMQQSSLAPPSVSSKAPSAAPVGTVAALESAVSTLQQLLESTSAHVDSVVAGSTAPEPFVGRLVAEAMAAVPRLNPEVCEKLFNDNLQDMLMVMYLANLTKTQIAIAEKLTQSLTLEK